MAMADRAGVTALGMALQQETGVEHPQRHRRRPLQVTGIPKLRESYG